MYKAWNWLSKTTCDNTHSCRGQTMNKEQLSNYLFGNAYGPVLAQQVLPKRKRLAQLRIS